MKTQKGRSFIEMLAVLSIMALISFAAYRGLDAVLQKRTTDNIWKEVMIRASALRSNKKGNTSIAGFASDAHGVNWQVVPYTTETKCGTVIDENHWLGIRIYNADKKLVQRLIAQVRLEKPKTLVCLYGTNDDQNMMANDMARCPGCDDLFFIFKRGTR